MVGFFGGWMIKKLGSCPEGYEEVFKDSGIIYVGGMLLSDSIILNR